jgi:thymidylate kinase
MLAKDTESQYYYWMEKNKLKSLRERFDNSPPLFRFMYYTFAALDTHQKAEKIREHSDVFVDRTMASTIAYHRALGLSDLWISMIPKFTIENIDKILYFTASDETRLDRMQQREGSGERLMTPADHQSLAIGKRIDEEYRRILPDRTIVISTDDKTPEMVVEELKGLLYA